MTPDTPTSDAQVVWVRYVTAMVAPFLDRDVATARLDDGWRLVVGDPIARAALTQWLEVTFDLLDRTTRRPGSGHRTAPTGCSNPATPGRDAVPDSCPRVTPGARAIRAAISRAVRQELRVVVHRIVAPAGQPQRLNGLRLVVDRWVTTWIARTGHDEPAGRSQTSPSAPPHVRQPSVAASLLINGLWDSMWPFEPSDLELAIRSVWAEIAAQGTDADPVVGAAQHARVAWDAAEAFAHVDAPALAAAR